MERSAKIYVAGHRGLVGSAIVRRLALEGYGELLLRSSAELDLSDQAATRTFFEAERPDFVFLAAARVGGIAANDRAPADFIRENLQIQTNVIEGAHRADVKKLLFLASSCVYPRLAPQPIREEHLLGGPLEPTNEAYAIAKIAGLLMCKSYKRQYGSNFIAAMPSNLYGPGDNFDLDSAHVLPAMIRRFHEAKVEGRPRVVLWGSGTPRREFLHVDDLASALLLMMRDFDAPRDDPDALFLNVGTGRDISIRELAQLIREVVGFEGDIGWDASKPDGTPQKLLSVERIRALGWQEERRLRDGIAETYAWFKEEIL